jgi:hypothetical protein
MITWILGTILIVWCVIRRFLKNGRVEEYPLGMPRGTVRAIITLMVVSFPFTYLLNGTEIEVQIINAIFILAAFYFEARRNENEEIEMAKEIKNPEKYKQLKTKEKYPLYLPKYSVRIMLMIILLIIFLINMSLGVSFQIINTIFNILIIVVLYFIGTLFQNLASYRNKKKVIKKIQSIENYQNKSEFELYEIILTLETNPWKRRWRNIYSLITFGAVVTSLILFEIDIDFLIPTFFFSPISLRSSLLLIINIYYGFRF